MNGDKLKHCLDRLESSKDLLLWIDKNGYDKHPMVQEKCMQLMWGENGLPNPSPPDSLSVSSIPNSALKRKASHACYNEPKSKYNKINQYGGAGPTVNARSDDLQNAEPNIVDKRIGATPALRAENTQVQSIQEVQPPDVAENIPQPSTALPVEKPPYFIEKVNQKMFKKNAASVSTFKVTFDDRWEGKNLKDIFDSLRNMFDTILKQARGDLTDTDKGMLLLHHPSLDGAIVVSLRPWGKLDGNAVLERLEHVLYSKQKLTIDEHFEVTVGTVRLPKGGRGGKITKLTGDNNSLFKKRSILKIVNNDNLCAARAIVMCMAKSADVPKWKFKKLREDRNGCQKKAALDIQQKAGIPTDRPCTLSDIQAFEFHLGVNIAVVGSKIANKFMYFGAGKPECKLLFLYLVETGNVQHFHSIVNICGFFGRDSFCTKCMKPYYSGYHTCSVVCNTCKAGKCLKVLGESMTCEKCNKECRSKACFERHRQIKSNNPRAKNRDIKLLSPCQTYWKCVNCSKEMKKAKRSPENHKCFEWFCENCNEWCIGEHYCYMRACNPTKARELFIVFDFECTQNTIMHCSRGYSASHVNTCKNCTSEDTCAKCLQCRNCEFSWCGKYGHIPNLCIAQTFCEACLDIPVSENSKCDICGMRCAKCDKRKKGRYLHPPCENTCGFRETIFSGPDTQERFGEWLFSDSHKGYTVIGHYAGRYDHYLILEELMKHSMRPKPIIYSGSRIMYFYLPELCMRFLDSFSFLPMKLAKLPKSFGFTEMEKGYFCHKFNILDNWDYEGEYPAPEFYGVDTMNKHDRIKFYEWYNRKKDKIFNFQMR